MAKSTKLTPGQVAECKGHDIADVMLSAIAPLNEDEGQTQAIRALQNAILDICELPRRDRAAAGFAIAVTCFLQRGMRAQ